jgi:hypothetical protein
MMVRESVIKIQQHWRRWVQEVKAARLNADLIVTKGRKSVAKKKKSTKG